MYDYNNPIKITDIDILDIVREPQRKLITFEYKGQFFIYKYSAHGSGGGIHIYQYDSLDTAMNPLSRTGKETIIYNTYNAKQCTDLGQYLEYSIMKFDKRVIYAP